MEERPRVNVSRVPILVQRILTTCLLVVASGITGCAALAPPPPVSDTPFDIVGRVAVSFDGRAFSSNLRWRHAPGRGEVWLSTPLGQTVAHIESGAAAAFALAMNRSSRKESRNHLTTRRRNAPYY